LDYILRAMDSVDFSPAVYVSLVPAEKTRGLTKSSTSDQNTSKTTKYPTELRLSQYPLPTQAFASRQDYLAPVYRTARIVVLPFVADLTR